MNIRKIIHTMKFRARMAMDKSDKLLAKMNKKQKGSFGLQGKARGNEPKERPFFGFGKGMIGYLLLLALAVVFTQALHSPLSAILLVFLIIWPILNLVYVLIVFASIDAYVENSDMSVIKNTPTKFKIQIINHSPFPVPFAEADFRVPDKSALRCVLKRIKIAAPPNSDYLIDSTVTFAYRGTYDVGIDCLYVYDFFKLFRFKVRLYNYRSIYVMPRRFAMSADVNRATSDTATDIRRSAIGIDRNDVSDIRRYEPGDPMKSVHWKLSSKSEELQVKQYDMNTGKTVYLFCDLAAHFDPVENAAYDEDINEHCIDGVVELALAIATRTLMEGNTCVPVWYDSRGEGGVQAFPCATQDELENVLRMLATAPVCDNTYRVGKLTELVNESQSISLVYVTDYLDGEFLADVTVSASLIGNSGSVTEVYFFNPAEKINDEKLREKKNGYFARCKRVFANHNVNVTETTAEECSKNSAAY